MNWNRLEEKVLEEHYPEEKELEKTRQKYREIAGYIESEFGRETHFAGSSARGTCMKGDRDIDIFVLFPEDTDKKELEDRGLEIGKKTFEEFDGEYEIEFAEHPYTRGKINGHEVEIVPCYDVAPEKIKSSVDRTPHHSRWVKQELDEEQKKEVVLLKVFLRAAGIYGSSLKVRGFSGYLCEILVSEYGSFEELIWGVNDWNGKEVIDPENHHENGLPNELEEKFSEDNLVVIDPVDPERNVAAALSRENYARFIYQAWRLRQEPGMDFFSPEEPDYTEFDLKQEIEERSDFLVLRFENVDEVDDIVYPQMRKTLRRLEQILEKNDFRVFNSGFHVGDETRIYFELERELPGIKEKKGPKVFHGEDHLAQFTGKYDNVFVRDDRVYAKTEREFTDAKKLVQDFLKGDLKEKGIPGHVAEKLEDYSFVDPLEGDERWLNHLAKKLHVNQDG
ncbi:MAG: CCA tRNA nucleotidyltransferase [Candidatus Nanohaloarchaea archaeon]